MLDDLSTAKAEKTDEAFLRELADMYECRHRPRDDSDRRRKKKEEEEEEVVGGEEEEDERSRTRGAGREEDEGSMCRRTRAPTLIRKRCLAYERAFRACANGCACGLRVRGCVCMDVCATHVCSCGCVCACMRMCLRACARLRLCAGSAACRVDGSV
jgi:hypothetical protein